MEQSRQDKINDVQFLSLLFARLFPQTQINKKFRFKVAVDYVGAVVDVVVIVDINYNVSDDGVAAVVVGGVGLINVIVCLLSIHFCVKTSEQS